MFLAFVVLQALDVQPLDTLLAVPATGMTFASGPTNSLRGASLLTGLADAVVVDICGTTSDAGVLRGGFQRESYLGVEIGGALPEAQMMTFAIEGVAPTLARDHLAACRVRAIVASRVGGRVQIRSISRSIVVLCDEKAGGSGPSSRRRSRSVPNPTGC